MSTHQDLRKINAGAWQQQILPDQLEFLARQLALVPTAAVR